jgi:hypothetical protein
MKTKRYAMKTGGLLTMIMTAVLALTIMGCEKVEPIPIGESMAPEDPYIGNIMYETFWVYPAGTNVNLFDEEISLEFPEGAVSVPTEFTLASFHLHHLDLDAHNLYNRGYSLVVNSLDQNFRGSIKLNIKYDLSESNWLKSVPVDAGSITILCVSPTIYAYETIVSIGNCSTDFSSMIIKGYIYQCGFYVVGEN